MDGFVYDSTVHTIFIVWCVFRKVRLGIELFALVVRCNGGVGKPDRVPFKDAMVDVGGSLC